MKTARSGRPYGKFEEWWAKSSITLITLTRSNCYIDLQHDIKVLFPNYRSTAQFTFYQLVFRPLGSRILFVLSFSTMLRELTLWSAVSLWLWESLSVKLMKCSVIGGLCLQKGNFPLFTQQPFSSKVMLMMRSSHVVVFVTLCHRLLV